jgi:hypothetical protein
MIQLNLPQKSQEQRVQAFLFSQVSQILLQAGVRGHSQGARRSNRVADISSRKSLSVHLVDASIRNAKEIDNSGGYGE